MDCILDRYSPLLLLQEETHILYYYSNVHWSTTIIILPIIYLSVILSNGIAWIQPLLFYILLFIDPSFLEYNVVTNNVML